MRLELLCRFFKVIIFFIAILFFVLLGLLQLF